MDEKARIGIVVALREERLAIEGAVRSLDEALWARVLVLQGGLGGAMAGEAARKLLDRAAKLKLLVSCGFSGGLVEPLGVGGVVLGSFVLARPSLEQSAKNDAVLDCSAELRAKTSKALSSAEIAFREGRLVTLGQPVLRPEEKRSLGKVAQADAVDMESAAVGRIAREKQIGFLALRTISDAVNDELPPEVAKFLDEKGRVRAGRVLSFVFRGPGNVKELWRLKSRSDRAAAALRDAVQVALPIWLESLSD